ncbi:MAG: hypothetical protein ACK4RK_04425 [Gemmataceae bacterium]
MCVLPDAPSLATILDDRLRHWQATGQAWRWVEAHHGHWNHDDWLTLLHDLRQSDCWPLPVEEVGRVLEERKRRWWKLRHWRESGQAWQWITDHAGHWSHDDWLSLLDELEPAGFAPVEAEAVGAVLEELKAQWWKLHQWRESGLAWQWVKDHQGQWNHDDWLSLLQSLTEAGFGSLPEYAVGQVLEELRQQWSNLRRWRDAGLPRWWVEEHAGAWTHDDWLALVQALRQSAFWPLPLEEVGQILQEYKQQYWNLRRWRDSNQPKLWVEEHHGCWNQDDWLRLLDNLQQSEYWPLDPAAVSQVMDELQWPLPLAA